MIKIFAASSAYLFGLLPLEIQAQAIEVSGSLLNELLASMQDDLTYNAYMNVSLNQAIAIDASISAIVLGGIPESDVSNPRTPITARLGPISTMGIGTIMPESVLDLQSNPLSATIYQSEIAGNFRTLQIANTASTHAVHAENYGGVPNIPNFVVNASVNASTLVTDIDLQIRSVSLSLQEAETFGVGSAISGRIYSSTRELQLSLTGSHN